MEKAENGVRGIRKGGRMMSLNWSMGQTFCLGFAKDDGAGRRLFEAFRSGKLERCG